MVTEQEVKNWYDDWYSERGVKSMRPYQAYIPFLKYFEKGESNKLLDVACGTGYLLKAGIDLGFETYGVDISEEACKIAKEVSPKSVIKNGKGEELDFPDNFFDFITCIGSLEHFLNMKKGLDEFRRVSKNDAKFLIVVPNSNFILWKISSKYGTAQQDINEKLLSKNEWMEIFRISGFQILKIGQDKWFQEKIKIFSSFNPLIILKNIVLKLAWIFLPLNLTYQFVFLLKKK